MPSDEPATHASLGLVPEWDAPAAVGALMSTRHGGVSQGPYSSLNLGVAVNDTAECVAENRLRFAAAIGAAPVWMRQVHGTRVLSLPLPAGEGEALPQADAAVTATPGVACTVQVADCLPVLFAARNARAVGAAHAGWRGLSGGVLENTVRAVADLAQCALGDVAAWLGPCIGPWQFEVGEEVLMAFGAHALAPGPYFQPRARADGSAAWVGDLQGLARARLHRLGLTAVAALPSCTVSDDQRWFSYRREPVSGRLAAAVWLR
jgi:polyphenol oxidase